MFIVVLDVLISKSLGCESNCTSSIVCTKRALKCEEKANYVERCYTRSVVKVQYRIICVTVECRGEKVGDINLVGLIKVKLWRGRQDCGATGVT